MKLTETKIRNAKPVSGAIKLSDGRGLFLFVAPTGGKLWRAKYRFEGKEKLISYGRYPDVCLAKVREAHQAMLSELASGIDPMAARKERKTLDDRTGLSFESVAESWHRHWLIGKSPRHGRYVLRRLKADVYPAIGNLPINQVDSRSIVAMVKAIEQRGASEIAKRALEMTSQIFRYAIAHGLAERNPASDVKPRDILLSRRKQNYNRVEERELPELLRKIETYPGTHLTRLAMKLLALTFVRTGELIGARWEEFDLPRQRWNIPAERMKMRTPHIVPLSTQALEVLALLRDLSGETEWVFPGERNPKKCMSNNTILKGLERIGYKGRMTGHGFRGLASTILHEQGYPHEHIELQLAHTQRNAVSAAYNHALHLPARAKMMQDWANYLETKQRGASVLEFVGTVA